MGGRSIHTGALRIGCAGSGEEQESKSEEVGVCVHVHRGAITYGFYKGGAFYSKEDDDVPLDVSKNSYLTF